MTPLSLRLHAICQELLPDEIPPFSVGELTGAVKALGDSELVEAPPTSHRLDRLRVKIRSLLSSDARTLELSTSEWLDVPWLALELTGARSFCEDTRFRNGLLTAANASAHVGRRCIQVFLRDYAPNPPGPSEALGGVILETLRVGHVHLKRWEERNRVLNIFAPLGGPDAVVSNIRALHLQTPLISWLNEVELASGGFSFAMLLAWCRNAHSRAWEGLDVIDNWIGLFADLVTTRFVAIVESLLHPWRIQDPEPEWRKALLAWLLRKHGDPRQSVPGFWSQVDAGLRAVAVRWLTLQTIEGFFETLDEYARRQGDDVIRRQWPFRRAFWLAYYRKGVILDAKIAIGRAIEEEIGWETLRSRFESRVARLDAPDLSQSALLMQVRGLVVFVGTHNASCRIWDDTSHAAPDLRRMRFRYNEIVTDPRSDLQTDPDAADTGIRHAGSESGAWQRKLGNFLRDKIGENIRDIEWTP